MIHIRRDWDSEQSMAATSYNIYGTKVLACSPDGKKVRTDRDAVELIGEAYEQEARWIVIPTERFEDAFFQLHTRIAGEIIGKFAVYKMRVAIVGDISRHTEASSSLRASFTNRTAAIRSGSWQTSRSSTCGSSVRRRAPEVVRLIQEVTSGRANARRRSATGIPTCPAIATFRCTSPRGRGL